MTRQQVPNAEQARDTARANLLVNGGMEIWQRGNGPFTNSWMADRWAISLAGSDSLGSSRDSANADSGSQYCAVCTYTRVTGGSMVYQTMPDLIPALKGRTLTFSIRVRVTAPNLVRARITDGITPVFSSYHTGSSTYETLTVSTTMSASATAVHVALNFEQSCTAYIDNAMLVVGSVAADYAPMHPADDLARCLRYYEQIVPSPATVGTYLGVAQAYSTTAALLPLSFKVTKAVTPTYTHSNATHFQALSAVAGVLPWVSATAVNPTLSQIGLAPVVASSLVAGNASLCQVANASAIMVVEANP